MATVPLTPSRPDAQRPEPPRPEPQRPEARPDTNVRKLVVGREIVFSGEIKSCDCLVVEGTVKANIADCDDIQIAEGGLFAGQASVKHAEIRGRFEGELAVSDRLFLRSTGRINAKVRYHQIEIECGGQISGEIEAQEGPKQASAQKPMAIRA